ncbi:hypothetical protein M513_03705 [Trichuris suis]|uniref:GP-PDE domain-containing protein n=1 Tax=Trichuris suis TaxID=68888 RepID=A0A085MDR9_9BILA|nr:hypothetical protein M513_03705 [Trichuris suis]
MGTFVNVELMMLLAFCSYCFLSYVLLKSPFHWHQYPMMTFRAQNVAHRAGGGEAHENTLNAVLRFCTWKDDISKSIFNIYRSACNGADMVELDCQLTADGKVVVAHEDYLLRVAGVNEYISNLPYKKLPVMKKQVESETDPGKVADREEKIAKTILEVKSPETQNVEERRIPLLEEIFQSLRYLPINIDIKQDDEILINEVSSNVTASQQWALLLFKKVNRMVIEYEREESTVWGNEDEEISKKLYALNPKVHLFFSAKRVIRLLFLFYTGLLPFVPMKERFLEIPMLSAVSSYPEVRRKFGMFANLIMQMGDALLLSPVLFDHLSRRKIHVFLWVLNKEEQFKRAFELGATAVMTDYPTKLAEYLLHHPPKEPVEFPRLEAVAEGIEIAKKEVEAVAEGLEIAKKEVKSLCP